MRSADPLADPIIETNYLSDPEDQAVMVEGLKMVRDIYDQPGFKDVWSDEEVPGRQYASDDEILTAIRKFAGTVYHPAGTCRMGSDDSAVVDPQLRVREVEGLRVVDASVMPKITSANTNAATYMIAEKAAEMIRSDC